MILEWGKRTVVSNTVSKGRSVNGVEDSWEDTWVASERSLDVNRVAIP